MGKLAHCEIKGKSLLPQYNSSEICGLGFIFAFYDYACVDNGEFSF